MKTNLEHFILIEYFWWKDNAASKPENFWPFFCFSGPDMIFSERIGKFVLATLATQQDICKYWPVQDPWLPSPGLTPTYTPVSSLLYSIPSQYITNHQGQLSLPSLRVDQSSTNLPGWG